MDGASPGQEQFHPIACEACRAKRCKCDRELPSCSQCSSIGTPCRYPQGHKRGIPTGYIACVEQRLLETEVILFELLSATYGTPVHPQDISEAFAEYSTKQSKLSKVEEWGRLPLRSKDQQYAWWNHKAQFLHRHASTGNAISAGVLSQTSPDDFSFNQADIPEASHLVDKGEMSSAQDVMVYEHDNFSATNPSPSRVSAWRANETVSSEPLVEPSTMPQQPRPEHVPDPQGMTQDVSLEDDIGSKQPAEQLTVDASSKQWLKYF